MCEAKRRPIRRYKHRAPGDLVQVDVCRDSSATYAEAIRRALPAAVQVADCWHLWSDQRNRRRGSRAV